MVTEHRSSPYQHSDGSNCWTKNCSLGNQLTIMSAAAKGDVNAFLAAKQQETKNPDTKTLLKMFSNPVPKTDKWKQQFGSRPSENNYYMTHRAPDGSFDDEEGFNKGCYELANIFPENVLTYPNWYCGTVDPVAVNIMREIQGNPEAIITIYRAVPPNVNKINNGDWITLSKKYAQQHAMRDDDPKHDWVVLEAKVPAKVVWTDANDLNEFGLGFKE